MRAATVSCVPRVRRSPSNVSTSPPREPISGSTGHPEPSAGRALLLECARKARMAAVSVGPYDAALRRHRAWMATSAAKEVYKLRKQLVEPVFGIIKEQRAGRRFLLRGLANVAAEWTVLATAFNLRTLWRVWRYCGFGHVFGGHHVPHRGPQSLIALPESCR